MTFDTRLQYQPARSWDVLGAGPWRTMDTPVVQGKGEHFSGVILELKTLHDAPLWMMELVSHFGLKRTGHCKYSNALTRESTFTGRPEWRCKEADVLTR